jgi:hypothetical protein
MQGSRGGRAKFKFGDLEMMEPFGTPVTLDEYR